MVSRALSANAATGGCIHDSIVCAFFSWKDWIFIFLNKLVVELSRDGPLMEYGRRIAAGELLDGDASQVC